MAAAAQRLTWIALAILGGIQWTAVSWPPLMHLLGTVSLSPSDWALVTLWIACPVLLLETLKAAQARVRR